MDSFINVTASDGLPQHITKLIYRAKQDGLKPIGIIMGATSFLKFYAELALVQRVMGLNDGYPLQYMGLPIRVIPEDVVTLEYEVRDASRLSFGDKENEMRQKQ